MPTQDENSNDSNTQVSASVLSEPYYMPVIKRDRRFRILTEIDIRNAIKHTDTNKEAAQYLNVTVGTFKKYAERYYNPETGESLYQENRKDYKKIRQNWTKEQWKEYYKKIFLKKVRRSNPKKDLFRVLTGFTSFADSNKFKNRLIEEGIKSECDICGFSERRAVDGKIPLTLKFKDGDKTNQHLDNIEMVCLNCSHLYYGTRSDGSAQQLVEHYSDIRSGVRSSSDEVMNRLASQLNLSDKDREDILKDLSGLIKTNP